MISLKEKLPDIAEAPEKNSPLSKRMKIALMRAAVRAVTFSGENIGSQGKHALRDNNYHTSAARYIEEARANPEAAQEARDRLQRAGRNRGSVSVAELQYEVGHLPEVISISRDPRYLYGVPDSQLSHRRPKKSNQS